jgi:hypothetical protein
MGSRALYLLGLALLLTFALPARAQIEDQNPSRDFKYQITKLDEQEKAWGTLPKRDLNQLEMRLHSFNAVRQQTLVSDTNKLLKLAHELDDEIGRTKPESLTQDQLRKIAKIEKLAHSVKENMARTIQGSVFELPTSQ